MQTLLELARGELGTRESPAGSNRVKYNTAYYGREVSGAAYPWCCVFIWWLFREAGLVFRLCYHSPRGPALRGVVFSSRVFWHTVCGLSRRDS